ncbi:unnamed protein product [Parnassius apollo]|uniref:(apollo) hypothetical protein n=1 Tax=Parnassius apollo TaxID=110799 RepID=A0A8S3X5Z4_PARAO|nr:unnamed protein product [Parnassius apollo]
MAQIEPMDIDIIDSDFDNKENSFHHSNVLSRTTCTEKGYEELDVSELNMKLRYSITPASSPMSKSFTANCLDNRTYDSEDYLNNVVINENGNLTRSLNSTITRPYQDTNKSVKSLPLKVLSTDQKEDRSASVLRSLDSSLKTDEINVTLSVGNDNIDNVLLQSASSSVTQTPEATTPTKEIPKHDGGSPIMRGLKTVLNMFRSSQSPIPPPDSHNDKKSEALSPTDSTLKGPVASVHLASTPIANKNTEDSRRCSPLKESIVFNDDLERELQWKDETTILFKEEKIPIHKLFLPQTMSSVSKTADSITRSSKKEQNYDLNASVEYMDILNNDSLLGCKTTENIQPTFISNKNEALAVESDGEFVDCETILNSDGNESNVKEEIIVESNEKKFSAIIQYNDNKCFQGKSKQSIGDNNMITDLLLTDKGDMCHEINLNKNIQANCEFRNTSSDVSLENTVDDQSKQASVVQNILTSTVNEVSILKDENSTKLVSNEITNKISADKLTQYSQIEVKVNKSPENSDSVVMPEGVSNKYNCKNEHHNEVRLPSDIPLPDDDFEKDFYSVNPNALNPVCDPVSNGENLINEHKVMYDLEMKKCIDVSELSVIQVNNSKHIFDNKELFSLEYTKPYEIGIEDVNQTHHGSTEYYSETIDLSNKISMSEYIEEHKIIETSECSQVDKVGTEKINNNEFQQGLLESKEQQNLHVGDRVLFGNQEMFDSQQITSFETSSLNKNILELKETTFTENRDLDNLSIRHEGVLESNLCDNKNDIIKTTKKTRIQDSGNLENTVDLSEIGSITQMSTNNGETVINQKSRAISEIENNFDSDYINATGNAIPQFISDKILNSIFSTAELTESINKNQLLEKEQNCRSELQIDNITNVVNNESLKIKEIKIDNMLPDSCDDLPNIIDIVSACQNQKEFKKLRENTMIDEINAIDVKRNINNLEENDIHSSKIITISQHEVEQAMTISDKKQDKNNFDSLKCTEMLETSNINNFADIVETPKIGCDDEKNKLESESLRVDRNENLDSSNKKIIESLDKEAECEAQDTNVSKKYLDIENTIINNPITLEYTEKLETSNINNFVDIVKTSKIGCDDEKNKLESESLRVDRNENLDSSNKKIIESLDKEAECEAQETNVSKKYLDIENTIINNPITLEYTEKLETSNINNFADIVETPKIGCDDEKNKLESESLRVDRNENLDSSNKKIIESLDKEAECEAQDTNVSKKYLDIENTIINNPITLEYTEKLETSNINNFADIVETPNIGCDDEKNKLESVCLRVDRNENLHSSNKKIIESLDKEAECEAQETNVSKKYLNIENTIINNPITSASTEEINAQAISAASANALLNMSICKEGKYENEGSESCKDILCKHTDVNKIDPQEENDTVYYQGNEKVENSPCKSNLIAAGDHNKYLLNTDKTKEKDGCISKDIAEKHIIDGAPSGMEVFSQSENITNIENNISFPNACIPDVLNSTNKNLINQSLRSSIRANKYVKADSNKEELKSIYPSENMDVDVTLQEINTDDMSSQALGSIIVDNCQFKKSEKEEGMTKILENSSLLNSFPDKNNMSPKKLNKDLENEIETTETKVMNSPPLSPKISSKGYNLNFDEINDPFVINSKQVMAKRLENKSFSVSSVESHKEPKQLKAELENIIQPLATNTKVMASPPLSPKISSKGYNFDESEDPFVTKTKIRMSPPPEGTPSSLPLVGKSSISTKLTKKDLQKRKSLPEKKRQLISQNKRNSVFDIPGMIENSKNMEAVMVQDLTDIINPVDISSSNVSAQDTLVESIEVTVCQGKEFVSDTENTQTNCGRTESSLNEQNMLSVNNLESKNVFNLPEMSSQMTFKVTKSRFCQSLSPHKESSKKDVFETPFEGSSHLTRHDDDGKNAEDVDNKQTDKIEHDSSIASSSSKETEDATVREVNTEDEDTVEGPFFESDEIINADKISHSGTENDDMMHFSDLPTQGNDDNENGEMFIDAEAYHFLLNQNKSNVVVNSGKESLFLKFDPLFAKRMSSDGALAALNNVHKRQSTPKRISRVHTVDVSYSDKLSPGPSNSNITTDINNTFEANTEDPNITVSKPMMVVNPAINSIVSPRNKSSTPPRTNRRSLTFTSPAIAVIDRLLSLSANNSPINHDRMTTELRREQNETDLALTQLRELLAEKEIHVHNLRSESKELRERLSTLESQVKTLETESEQRLRKVNELNERLVEKTKINKSMAAVVEEYERTIASLIAETEQDKKLHEEERTRLINERDEQTAHLASMEISFNDLHSKYEKSKQIILSCKANEDTYKKSIQEFEESLQKMQNNYELLKQHATSKLNHANQELERLNRSHEAEILKLNAMIKRKELHITSLEETLAQKTKANEELTAICDELINKVG